MEEIYFATTNEGKLKQAERVLDGALKINGVSIQTPENGLTCEANAREKLLAARRKLGDCTIIADDYSIEIEGVTLGDVCRREIIEVLTQNIDINIRQGEELPFPGVFANRILDYFDETRLFEVIHGLGLNRPAQAKIVLAIHRIRKRATSIIRASADLRLQEIMTGNGWFWNRIYKDSNGISCTSDVWLTTNSPRAHAFRELKRALS